MSTALRRLLLGRPLATAAEVHERLTKVKALAVFSSDALSSVAYATEEILLVLVLAGSGALSWGVPVGIAIGLLTATVASSYYQTVHGYPAGGGAYTVAHENLGVRPGLVAASALIIDYVLTVAVSTCAGVAAITSAFGHLLPYRIELAILAILIIAWGNLRGVRESGTVFAVPTYCFIVLALALIGVGLVRTLTGSIAASLPVPGQGPAMQPLTVFLILRAFASGCAALTGIEAISNAVPAFHKPEADNAGKTLIAMAALLMSMFLGITWLAHHLGIEPVGHETVVSQIGRRVFGYGPVYLALQAATALILVLAANTSFAGFPRLTSVLARDGYLPRQLANLGDRLVFKNGILVLAVLAALLVWRFEADTHKLIPLYAVGVFLAFTLSQTGMVRYWRRHRGSRWQLKASINGLGAVATGIVLVIIASTKFIHGAWIVVGLIPVFVHALYTIRSHYQTVAEQLSLDGISPEEYAGHAWVGSPKVVVPVSDVHQGTLAALRFARSLSDDATAVTVAVDPQATEAIQAKWKRWVPDVPLVVVESPYRSIMEPLVDYLHQVDAREPERGLAVVVLPEFVPAGWWQHLLHNQTALMLKTLLVYKRRQRGEQSRVVINVPFHLQR